MTPHRFAALRLLLRFSRARYVPLEAAMPPPRRPSWPRYVYDPAPDAAVWNALVQRLAVAYKAGELTPREYGLLLDSLSRQWAGWRRN